MRKTTLLGTLLCAILLTACDGETSDTTTTTTTTDTGGGGAGGGGAGGGGAGGGGAGGGQTCTPLTVSKVTVDSFGFLSGPVTVEGPDSDRFDIQLYELNGPQETGTFDLATAPDDNYASCDRCVLVYADINADGAPTKTFFQESGTIKIDAVDSPPGPLTVGSLTNVKLIEVTIDPDDYTSVPVANGACLVLDSLAWDTTPVNGTPCTSAEDCSNPLLQVCDVGTETCVAGQCDGDTLMCGVGETCATQADGANVGACYLSCKPFTAATCPDEYECVNSSLDALTGVCSHVGPGATGSDCVAIDTGTACVAGDVCAQNAAGQLVCQQQCTIFEADPGCPAASECAYNGLCGDGTGTDPAAVGATCAGANADFGVACGPSAGAFRGVCYNEVNGDPLDCGKVCRLAAGFETDCPAAEFCYDLFDVEIGVCYPDPVCGNSMVEPGETCDDGNMAAGDGCSDTCLVEPEFYCTGAVPAVLGANMGDTTGGSAVFSSNCNLGTDHLERIYTYTPAATGTLHLVLASDSDQGIYVRTTCDDAMTELGCADAVEGGIDEVLDVAVTAGTPVTIFVDGYVGADSAGPYTLTISEM